MDKIEDVFEYIALEGYCFAEGETYPCKRDGVSDFCLQNHMCPYFDWAAVSYRDLLADVPLTLILRDKLVKTIDSAYWWLRWQISWFFGRKSNAEEMMDSMGLKVMPPPFNPKFLEKQQEFKEWKHLADENEGLDEIQAALDAWGVEE